MFAKHCFDMDYNTELTNKQMPELSVYVQGPPAPTNLSDTFSFEFALVQCFNIINTLSHFKYSTQNFSSQIVS